MSLLSDLPDDILNLISIRLNGFDNCSLWMASDSILRQRLVNNVITDFDIKYTIPEIYLWPGNFLKKLKRLSRLSLVVEELICHLPIQNVEFFEIPTLKSLRLDCKNLQQILPAKYTISSNNTTDPTSNATSSETIHTPLNVLFENLESLDIAESAPSAEFRFDFVCHLPQNLKSLSIFINDPYVLDTNKYLKAMPRTLTKLNIQFNMDASPFDPSHLPLNLTDLNINAEIAEAVYPKIPKNIQFLAFQYQVFELNKLSPHLPSGLRSLSILTDTKPVNESLSHLQHLEYLKITANDQSCCSISKCPPNLIEFESISYALPTQLEVSPFGNKLTTINMTRLESIGPEYFTSLPETVTSLSLFRTWAINPTVFKFFELLPKNLQTLRTNINIEEKISTLPVTLTDLTLSILYSTEKTYFDALPPKLERLVLEANLPESFFQLLPDTLKQLHVFSHTLPINDEMIGMLPKGLKNLKIGNRFRGDQITDACNFPNLEALMLQSNKTLTDAMINKLPRSLTYLSIPHNPNFTDECIKHLPPKLMFLDFSKSKNITPKSNQEFPVYLRLLYLRSSKGWNHRAAKDLPQYLEVLDVAESNDGLSRIDLLADRRRPSTQPLM